VNEINKENGLSVMIAAQSLTLNKLLGKKHDTVMEE
jgi:hypothetical protein